MAATVRRPDVLVDRYELGEELGRGGMGRVYRGYDRLLRRDVAVKVLAGEDLADGDFARACAREARAAARLVHPGIVTVHDIGVQDGHSFLVMELVPGTSLRQLMSSGSLSRALAVDIAAQVAAALDYAHRQGVLHCDVKPHNVIVSDVDPAPLAVSRAKLVDFGIARAASATRTITDMIVGSVGYMAPEQVSGEPIDGRTDVYALGVVLYEMLSGRLPFEGANVAAVVTRRLTSPAPPLRSVAPNVPPALEKVVSKALQRDPARRYATAAAFRDALTAVESAALADTPARPAPDRERGSRSPHIRVRPAPSGRGDGPDRPDPRDRRQATPARDQRPSGGVAKALRTGGAVGAASLQARPWIGLALGAAAVLLGLGLILAATPARSLTSAMPPESAAQVSAPAATQVAASTPPVSAVLPVSTASTARPLVASSAAPSGAAATTGPLLVAATDGPPGSVPSEDVYDSAASEDVDESPEGGWATFNKRSCQFSDPWAKQGQTCFGWREAGYRVWVVKREGDRWLVQDPRTGGIAYVNPGSLDFD